jgi:1-acyl-sn-glycerol-3-phosphate acyltransferase
MIYRVLRALFRVSLRGFFRNVEVEGGALIPTSGPVLFVANHTNAFVDPLVVLTSIDRRLTLTAKSTLTGSRYLSLILRGFGVVLLHRRQDRAEGAHPEKNVGALGECVDVLRAGGAVFVFPEGVSHSDPGMRPFKNGTARIVKGYLETDGVPPLSIVPVGLHFSKKDRWRSDAVALIGPVADARALADEAEDSDALTAALRQHVEAVTANFGSTEERELVTQAGRLMEYRPEGPEPLDRGRVFDAAAHVDAVHRLQLGAHRLRARDPALFEWLAQESTAITHELRELGVEPHEVSLSMHLSRVALFALREVEILLVGAPLALAGATIGFVPYQVTRRLVRLLSEDEDHPASNAVLLSIPIFLTWWLMIGIAALFFGVGWFLIVAVGAPFTGLVYLRYRDRSGGMVRRVRSFLLWRREPDTRALLEARLGAWQARLLEVEESFTHPEDRGVSDV